MCTGVVFVAIDGNGDMESGVRSAGAPQLELRDVASGERHTLVLSGELDMAWAPILDQALHRVCGDGAEAIALDLSGLTFMDSTGLRAVLLAKELCERNDCEFLLTPGPPQVQRLFELTGLLDRLPFSASATEV
jgi:anti-sigma B factor antagonist